MNGIFCFIDHPTEKHLLKFFLTFWTTVAPQSLSSDMVPIGISSSWTPSFVVIVRIYWAALITFSIPLERKYTRLISTWSSYCFALILWYWNHKDLFLSLVIKTVRKWKFLLNNCYKSVSGHFFAICILIFHKTEVQTVILRCLMGLDLKLVQKLWPQM